MGIILSCNDCPFNGQDNVYCRTCSILEARAAKSAHRIARHRRRASARRRRWLRNQSMVNELINIQLEEVEARYDPYWD